MMKPDCDRRKLGPGSVLTLVLAVLCTPVGWLFAQNAAGPEPIPVPSGQSIFLQFKEVDTAIESRSLKISSQTQAFAKEPDFAARKPTRGILLFSTNKVNGLPFIWDQSRGKLYVDLNRNRDLTDDPQGIFTSENRGLSSYYQDFRGIRVAFETPRGMQRACFDLNVYTTGAQPAFTIGTRCFWEGYASLQNRDLQVGLLENIVTPGSTDGAYLLIRPWTERVRGFSLYDRSVDAVNFCTNLYYGKQGYQVQCERVAQESAAGIKLQFNECSTGLGQVRLSGQDIKRLVLTGAQPEVPWTVVLDEPEATVQVPVGTYRFCQARLAKGLIEASYDPPRYEMVSSPTVAVVAGTNPVALEIGGPLTNTVSVQRYGRSLRFAYELIGAGGKAYQLSQRGREKPPRFSVVKDGKQIASGDFQFG